MKQQVQRILDYLFNIGVTLKGVDGVLELIGGFIFLFIKPATLNKIIIWLTAHEVAEDPKDILANWLITASHQFSVKAEIFIALYLLLHGAIKIFLVIALLKNKRWSYPAAIIFLLTFIAYQIYQLTQRLSIGLILLTIFDLFVVFLIWQEYYKIKNNSKKI
ncbi:MAG: DUF2127 domain-containing protein [Patescibacteria group bacterium]